jgi:F0F1-type ATP synthase gamma subunit
MMKFYVTEVNTTLTKELSHGLGITKHHVCTLTDKTHENGDVYEMQASVLEFFNEGENFQLCIMYTFFKNGVVLGSESFSYTPVEWSVEGLSEIAENHCFDMSLGDFALKVSEFIK